MARRWGLGAAAPSLELLQADRGGLRERLRLGFFVFNTDEYGPQVAAIHALGVPALLERFQAGETIAATDPAVLTLHANATAHRGQLAAAAGVSPGKLASGTLRNMLRAVGWELVSAGQINTRNEHRGAMAYRAEPIALPEGVDREALEAVFLEESKALLSTVNNCNNPPVTDA